VDRIDPRAAVPTPSLVFAGSDHWKISQVVPTALATYVVAAPVTTTKAKAHVVGHTGLYRIVGGQLVYVRSFESPGTLTAVTPLG
jgi:predicted alpha/beta hydrolase